MVMLLDSSPRSVVPIFIGGSYKSESMWGAAVLSTGRRKRKGLRCQLFFLMRAGILTENGDLFCSMTVCLLDLVGFWHACATCALGRKPKTDTLSQVLSGGVAELANHAGP